MSVAWQRKDISQNMNSPIDPIIEELDCLLLEWEIGSLSETGIQRLREILKSSLEARTHYAKSQLLTAAMSLESEAGLALATARETNAPRGDARTVNPASTTTGTAATSFSPWKRWAALAATILIGVLLGRVLIPGETDTVSDTLPGNVATDRPRGKREATAQGVAVLSRLVDIEWNDENVYEVGDALPPGRLAIKSGWAQVEFFCGATVVLEGPAEFELASSTLARIHAGRLRAQVPPAAIGFTIETNDMRVVDLGTEFGLMVSPEGANVHVFDGEVELHDQPSRDEGKTKQMLTAGQAVSRKANGDWAASDSDAEQFVSIEQLESQEIGRQKRRLLHWQAWSQKLREDPRLIAYYAFDDNGGWQRRLTSDIGNSPQLDGAIVGAGRLAGRWPGKGALEFKRSGDRVRVNIPGEFGSLTFACWTRIDSLDRWYNSLFLTDGYEQGEPHWQILDSGQLFFSTRFTKTKGKGPSHQPILSKPFWNPSLSGKWIHLATTYNVETQKVTHYLNGKMLSEGTIPDDLAVQTTRIGKASIGNWASPNKPDAHYAIRNLNGSIDEMTIFAAALTPEEILDFYENGKP